MEILRVEVLEHRIKRRTFEQQRLNRYANGRDDCLQLLRDAARVSQVGNDEAAMRASSVTVSVMFCLAGSYYRPGHRVLFFDLKSKIQVFVKRGGAGGPIFKSRSIFRSFSIGWTIAD